MLLNRTATSNFINYLSCSLPHKLGVQHLLKSFRLKIRLEEEQNKPWGKWKAAWQKSVVSGSKPCTAQEETKTFQAESQSQSPLISNRVLARSEMKLKLALQRSARHLIKRPRAALPLAGSSLGPGITLPHFLYGHSCSRPDSVTTASCLHGALVRTPP